MCSALGGRSVFQPASLVEVFVVRGSPFSVCLGTAGGQRGYAQLSLVQSVGEGSPVKRRA